MSKVSELEVVKKLTGKGDLLAEKVLEQVKDLRHEYNVHVIESKRAIDELSHEDLSPSSDQIVRRVYDKLKAVRDEYGDEHLFYNTLLKMIIPYERTRRSIVEEVRKNNVLPAAFQKELIAENEYSDWPIVSFCDDAIQGDDSNEEYQEKHRNCYRLLRVLRKRFNHYMKKLTWRYYLLTNGSNTRFEDGVNLQDVNGQCYATEEELEKVETDWRPLIQFFKIMNFDDRNFFYLMRAPSGTFGSINYAPDDSGKIRISYSIDPVVQIISKAIHKCMDYLVKRLACNGTYNQMSVIRNMVSKKINTDQLIISTDMSKYSDTLQIKRILELLKKIGFPEEILIAIEDLYTLPMYDSVLRRVTPRTTASYQGQYGDFPLITLKNIWNQLCVYDYLNWTYGTKFLIAIKMVYKHKVGWLNPNYTNSAVGDDTIMAFLNCNLNADLVYNVIRAVFNRDGVNINRTKTHILDRGRGKCDFIKRVITVNGLVPYLRWDGVTGTEDELCEELLRYYRDNIITNEQFRDVCSLSTYSAQLYSLHPINGGVIDRPITELDLLRMVRRAESLSERYRPRNRDEIRRWIDRLHQRGDQLIDTCLIGLVQYTHRIEEYDDDTDEEIELCDCSILEEEEVPVANEESVVNALLNLNWMGYENYELKSLRSLLGMTWEDIQRNRPDVALFLKDHEEKEIYRQMTMSKKVIKNTVYSDMFSNLYLPYVLPDSVERQMKCEISDFEERNRGAAEYVVRLMIRRNYSRMFTKTVYGNYYTYFNGRNGVVRMYEAQRSDYRFISYEEFLELLGISNLGDKDERLRRVYNNICYYYG